MCKHSETQASISSHYDIFLSMLTFRKLYLFIQSALWFHYMTILGLNECEKPHEFVVMVFLNVQSFCFDFKHEKRMSHLQNKSQVLFLFQS